MAIVGEPYNVDAHAKNPGLLLNMFFFFLTAMSTLMPIYLFLSCVMYVHKYCTLAHGCTLHIYCTVQLYRSSSLTDQSIASIQGTPDIRLQTSDFRLQTSDFTQSQMLSSGSPTKKLR